MLFLYNMQFSSKILEEAVMALSTLPGIGKKQLCGWHFT
jgi:hypothetical protein